MEIIFVGTGSGMTSLNRFHSSIILSSDNYNLLIDCGDSTARAFLNHGISMNSINGILITHFHSDHYCGLASFITQLKNTNRTDTIYLYVHSSSYDYLMTYLVNSYILSERFEFDIQVVSFNEDEEINFPDFLIETKNNSHLLKYGEYKTKYHFNTICSSLCIKFGNKNILYTSDVGSAEDLYLFKRIKYDSVIVESSHIEVEDIIRYYEKEKPGKIIFTHIKEEKEEELARQMIELNSKYGEVFSIAYDKLRMKI